MKSETGKKTINALSRDIGAYFVQRYISYNCKRQLESPSGSLFIFKIRVKIRISLAIH